MVVWFRDDNVHCHNYFSIIGVIHMTTSRILHAVEFAVKAHNHQRRRYGVDEPYVAHPIRVARIVADIINDEDTIVAAILHDVLEDCPGITAKQIYEEFGNDVLVMVQQLTDTPPGGGLNRRQRKTVDRERLDKAWNSTQTIKLADIIDNTASIVNHDPGFAQVYLAEIDLMLPLLRKKGHIALWEEAAQIVRDSKLKIELYHAENNEIGC